MASRHRRSGDLEVRIAYASFRLSAREGELNPLRRPQIGATEALAPHPFVFLSSIRAFAHGL